MIVVNARIETDPESIDALKSAIVDMEVATLKEEGCDEYSFSVELSDPSVLRVTERWRDSEALAGHMDSAHMKTFRDAMLSHPPKGMNAHFYEATEISPPSL